MAEIDKGSCGECVFFDEHDFIKGSSELWGVCSNFRNPVFYTISNNSPKQALMENGAIDRIRNFLATDTTCFISQKDLSRKI